MALTIAVGFVVDDAIVMLENIFRHIEDGMQPMDAAIKGAGEIGFTIVSISVSLIAVFIPLLLMGGIVGRLFREFAMTVTIAVVVSAFVSLTLTPMMCSRFLHHDAAGGTAGSTGSSRASSRRMIDGYRRTLDIALRLQFITLMTFLATVALTGLPVHLHPQGLLSRAGHRRADRHHARPRRTSRSPRCSAATLALAKVLMQDPDIDGYSASMGAGLGGQTGNNGRFFITLKPFSRAHASAQEIIARLRPKLAQGRGRRALPAGGQDIRVGGRLAKTQYQYTLQDPDVNELYTWAPKVLAKLAKLPQLRDVTTDQQMGGTTATLTIDRDAAVALRHPAAADRRHALRRVRPDAGHAVLHPGELLPRDPGGAAGDAERPGHARQAVREVAARGSRCRCRRFVKLDTASVAPLSISHQSQFPAVTISFNLAAGRRARRRGGRRSDTAMRDMGAPLTLLGTFQGTAQAFQASLASQPYLIAAALIAVYIILGILYESYILPLTILSTLPSAGVGALLILMLAALRSVGDRADRHHPADRHREEERHHDGRLRHQRRAARRRSRRSTRSARPACCASARS